VTKKLTRSKRRELRSKGQLRPLEWSVEARRAAEKQAEEAEASARIHEAREAIAQREAEDSPVSEKKGRRPRDLTVLLLFGVTAVAAILYWLSQRSPTPAKAEPAPPPSASAPTKAAPKKVDSTKPSG
jgi:hypothetical protein